MTARKTTFKLNEPKLHTGTAVTKYHKRESPNATSFIKHKLSLYIHHVKMNIIAGIISKLFSFVYSKEAN